MRALWIATLLVFFLTPMSASGQPFAGAASETGVAPRDARLERESRLILAYVLDDYSSDLQGWTGSALWQVEVAAKWALHGGLSRRTVDRARWTTGELGGVFHPTSRTLLYTEGAIGPGTFEGEDITYFRLRGGVRHQLLPIRLFAHAEAQRIDVAHVEVNLVSLGLAYATARRLSGEVAFTESFGGTLQARYALARLDLQTRLLAFFAAAALGQGGDVLFNGFPATADDDALFLDGAWGIAWQTSGYRLLLTVEVFNQERLTRWSYGVTLQVPLGTF